MLRSMYRLVAGGFLAFGLMTGIALPGGQSVVHAEGSPALSSGQVTKVDASAQKLTIRHGPLENLDMPAMTMVFAVAAPEMLQSVKSGDNIRFVAERVKGRLTVIRIEKTR